MCRLQGHGVSARIEAVQTTRAWRSTSGEAHSVPAIRRSQSLFSEIMAGPLPDGGFEREGKGHIGALLAAHGAGLILQLLVVTVLERCLE